MIEIGFTFGFELGQRAFWLILALALIWLCRELFRLYIATAGAG